MCKEIEESRARNGCMVGCEPPSSQRLVSIYGPSCQTIGVQLTVLTKLKDNRKYLQKSRRHTSA